MARSERKPPERPAARAPGRATNAISIRALGWDAEVGSGGPPGEGTEVASDGALGEGTEAASDGALGEGTEAASDWALSWGIEAASDGALGEGTEAASDWALSWGIEAIFAGSPVLAHAAMVKVARPSATRPAGAGVASADRAALAAVSGGAGR
ncbi:hypothetical protein OG943_35100 [Amycolatopsis sp. NBC_00345]|uniref:hypothetical protein n=1 Tax=Amycolatopsis sp. NBC_00345 TaxID=2975955 RepID=UPI002E25DEAF